MSTGESFILMLMFRGFSETAIGFPTSRVAEKSSVTIKKRIHVYEHPSSALPLIYGSCSERDAVLNWINVVSVAPCSVFSHRRFLGAVKLEEFLDSICIGGVV